MVIGIEIALIWLLYVKPLREQKELNERGASSGNSSTATQNQEAKEKEAAELAMKAGNLTPEQKKVLVLLLFPFFFPHFLQERCWLRLCCATISPPHERKRKKKKEKFSLACSFAPLKLLHSFSKKLEQKISRDWADPVVKFLKYSVSSGHEEETCVWLDVLLSRFFLELRRSDIYRNKLVGKFQQKLRQKLSGSSEFVVCDLPFPPLLP